MKDGIYLVEEAEVDHLENDYFRAFCYHPIGYIRYTTPPSAKYNQLANEIIIGTGWPIPRDETRKKYRFTLLTEIT
jgi:hypothetical protein